MYHHQRFRRNVYASFPTPGSIINVTSSTGYTERLRFLPHPWLHHQLNIINGLHGTFTLPSPPPAPSLMYHHQRVTRNVYPSFPTPGSIINATSSTGYTERLRFLPHPWLHHQCNIIKALHGTFTLPSPPPAPSSMQHHQRTTRNVYASFPTPGSIIN